MTDRLFGAAIFYTGGLLLLEVGNHPLADVAYDASMGVMALGLVVYGLTIMIQGGESGD